MDSIEILHGRGDHSLNLTELSLETWFVRRRIKRSEVIVFAEATADE